MEQARQGMKNSLKEIYRYNSYDWEISQKNAQQAHGPYSFEQHQAFMHKFALYFKDFLRQADAAINNMETIAGA